MLPFDMVTPSTPLFGVPRNMKEMKMCRWAVCSINCIWTSESGTLFPFSFSRSSRATLSAVSAVYSLVKAPKTTLKHQNSLKSLFELQHVVVFARLLFQYGVENCKKGYSMSFLCFFQTNKWARMAQFEYQTSRLMFTGWSYCILIFLSGKRVE